MTQIKTEHILIIGIIAFMLYHLTQRCNCMRREGFSIGGDVNCSQVVQGCTWDTSKPPINCVIIGSGQNFDECSKASGNSIWYEESINPLESWDTRFIGGWCQCAYENPSYWNASYSNTIVAGGFQPDGSIGPFCEDLNECDVNRSRTIRNKYKNKWLSIGGDMTGCKSEKDKNNNYIRNCPKYLQDCLGNAIKYIETFGFNGIAFDMEGCLALNQTTFNAITDWIKAHKKGKNLPNFKYVYVGGSWQSGYNFSEFTHICPMLYTNQNFYQRGNTGVIDSMLKSWTEKGFPKNKIILTFQAQSAAGGDQPRSDSNILKGNSILKQLTDKLNDGYAGLLGWPPVYPRVHADLEVQSQSDANLCLRLINKNLKRQPPPPPAPLPPSPYKYCGCTGSWCPFPLHDGCYDNENQVKCMVAPPDCPTNYKQDSNYQDDCVFPAQIRGCKYSPSL